jgi:hypothetical protein
MAVITLVALLLGLYYWTMTVEVSEVPLENPIIAGQWIIFHDWGDRGHEVDEFHVRTRLIARVSGMFFASGSRVVAMLYLVKNGNAKPIHGVWVRESSPIIFGLGDRDAPDGRVTLLGSRGGKRTGQEFWGAKIGEIIRHKAKSTAHTLSTGRIDHGGARVVYAEGERPPVVKYGMSIKDFAARNPGSYLVVTMCIE